jgi:lipopolysaccharide export system permease protein
MTTLDRYLLTRVVSALARTMLALVSIYILVDLLTHRQGQITRGDVPWSIVFQYYLALTPQMIQQVAPLAMLVSALLVLGEAAQHNEVTAALAGGVSLRRFVRMPVLVGAAFALGLFTLHQGAGAAAAREAKSLENNYFSQNPNILRDGVDWANLSGRWTCHIRKFNRIALTGEDVFIHSLGAETFEQVEVRRIYWDDEAERWLLEDGVWWEFPAGSKRGLVTRVTQREAPFTETPAELFALEEEPDTKTAAELARDLRAAAARNVHVGPLWVDYHTNFSWPAVSFVMVGLAIPFALRLRRGGLAISFGASIAIALVYIMVFHGATTLGHFGRLGPITAAWLANGVFALTGLVLFYRTPT